MMLAAAVASSWASSKALRLALASRAFSAIRSSAASRSAWAAVRRSVRA